MKVWLAFFALVAVAYAVPTKSFFYGTGTDEYVYHYELDVRTGVLETDQGSQYEVKADVHVRPDPSGNGTFVYLVDPTVYVYTGPLFMTGEMHGKKPVEKSFVPIVKEAEVFKLPFYVTYDKYGFVQEVFTVPEDVQWSVNIKKGIASVLQLPVDKVPVQKYVKPVVFHVVEESIYGKVNVTYDVETVKESIVVTKSPDFTTFEHMPYDVYSNVEVEKVYNDYKVWNVTYPEIKYVVVNDKDGVKVHEVYTENVKTVQPSISEGQMQYVATKQSFVFAKEVTPTTPMEFTKFVVYNPVEYTPSKTTFTTYFPCLSVVPHVVDMSVTGPKVQAMLYEAVEYLHENPITNVETDTKHGLTITRIVEVFKPFTFENFENFYTLITKTTTPKDVTAVDVFYKVLPLVGTKNSVVFIKNLVKSHKVKDFVSTTMLFSMGLNVRVPTVELLKEVEEFYHFEDEVKPEVAHAAILTFGTLVYKTFKHDTHSPVLQQYVKVYYKKLKEAKTFEDQLVWLHGLKNIEVGTVYELIVPIVKGEQVLDLHYDRHLRVHAVYSLEKILHYDYDTLFETVYPVFVEETLATELRVAALKVLLSTEEVKYFAKIANYIKTEKNPQVYSFFVTTVQHMAESCIHEETDYWQFVKQTEKFFKHVDTTVETQAFYYDYVDKKHFFGASVYGNLIADNKHNKVTQFYINFSPYVMDRTVDLYSVFVKFEGVENPLTMLWPKLFNVEPKTIKEPIIKHHEKEPVHVEFTLMANGKVVYTKYFDEETIKQFYSYTYLTILTTMKYQFTTVLNLADVEVFSPTLDGVQTKVDFELPLVSQFKYDVVVPTTKSAHEVTFSVHSYFRLWMHGFYGISVYNPFALTWQGSRRVQAFDFSVPFNFDVVFNFQQNSFKIVWTKSTNEVQNVVGFKTHVKTQVYARPDTEVDYLKSTCPACQQFLTTIVSPVHKKKDVVLFEEHSKYTGLHFYLSVYDVEVMPHVKYFKSLSDVFVSDAFYELSEYSFFKFAMTYYTWFYTHFFPPQYSTYGVVGYINPCKVYPFDKAEITFKVNTEVVPHEMWTTPNYYQYVKMSAVFKNDHDVELNHWDVNVHFTHEFGTYFKKFNVQVTRQTPGEKNLNVCLDYVKDVETDKVEGKMTYYHGYSYDHKCVKDDMVVSVGWTGTYSDTQKNYTKSPVYSYKECVKHYVNDYTPIPVTYDCAEAYTTVRKYVYNVDYQHVLPVYMDVFKPVWFWMQQIFPVYYDVDAHHHVPTGGFVVDVEYSLWWVEHPTVDVVVTSPEESFVFEHVPYYNWFWWFQPDSVVFTKYFDFMKTIGYTTECVVNPMFNYSGYHYDVSKTPVYSEWTLYAADHPSTYTWAIYVQKIEKNFVALKFVLNDHVVVLQPVVDKATEYTGVTKYTFTVDSYIMEVMKDGVVPGVYPFKYFQVDNTVVFVVPNVSLYVAYDGHQVVVETVKSDTTQYYGQCYV
ncbi:uncharacterized protein LOC120427964 [Culex pipiens pallens]|uniref:uncharacterized protein LOC120427964 n=1 Tax=Culex pipiens pallens TaxID=42434 RepID=UPI001954783F|nr:uncharacterized protein LOC120427964 [Culex pipiens pallens]